MAKLKFPRKNITLDMTAMCDVAFLLLTFFMLATKFKPDEPVIVDTPSSISEIKLPAEDIMTITVDGEGGVYFGIDNQTTRYRVLEAMADKYKVNFTQQEKNEFALGITVGMPIGNLKQILSTTSGYEKAKIEQPGIPIDSTNNQLRDWIDFSRRLNLEVTGKVPRVAIKGDQDANYAVVKEVIATLQDLNINRFNMITSLEAAPEGTPAAGAAASVSDS
jgi:biopolymer transport protein ExbD